MTDLRPMLVLVCWRCREGVGHPEHSIHHGIGSPCREEGCAFFGVVASPEPARTREEMLEAATGALSPYLDSRCGQCAGTGDDLRSNLDCTSCGATGYRFPEQGQRAATEAFIAAGVIEEAPTDA